MWTEKLEKIDGIFKIALYSEVTDVNMVEFNNILDTIITDSKRLLIEISFNYSINVEKYL